MINIPGRLCALMQDQKISIRELSEKTGIPKSAIQRYSTGETEKIPLDRIELLAKALGVSAAYLMGWEDADGNIKTPDGESEESLGDEFSRLFEQLPEEQKKAIVMQLEWLLSQQ